MNKHMHQGLDKASQGMSRVANALATPAVCGLTFLPIISANPEYCKSMFGMSGGHWTLALTLDDLPLLLLFLPFADLAWLLEMANPPEYVVNSPHQLVDYSKAVDLALKQGMLVARHTTESIQEKIHMSGEAFHASFVKVAKECAQKMNLDKMVHWIE